MTIWVGREADNSWRAWIQGQTDVSSVGNEPSVAVGKLLSKYCPQAMERIVVTEEKGRYFFASVMNRPDTIGSGTSKVCAIGQLVTFYGQSVDIEVRDADAKPI